MSEADDQEPKKPEPQSGAHVHAPAVMDRQGEIVLASSGLTWWQRDVPIAAGVILAFATIVLGIETQQATADQLKLSRQQLATSSRPAVVPVPDSRGRAPYDFVTGAVRFRVQNVADVPAIGGVVAVVPSMPEPDTIEGTDKYPTCGSDWAVLGHRTIRPLAPMASGQVATVEIEGPPFNIGGSLCVAIVFADAAGGISLTDWVWQKDENIEQDLSRKDFWIPADVKPYAEDDPEWWTLMDMSREGPPAISP